jgi:hypothetical protein
MSGSHHHRLRRKKNHQQQKTQQENQAKRVTASHLKNQSPWKVVDSKQIYTQNKQIERERERERESSGLN